MLNVVNFGGGTYVLYAEIQGDEIEVDSEPYGDNFARPARLLPLEAKALIAAIDLFGDHLPQTGLQSARGKIVDALGHDPSEEGLEIAKEGGSDSEVARIVNEAIVGRSVLELHYYKENEDQFTKRAVEPYRLENGKEGWYVECYDLGREAIRHFKLDRVKEAKVSGESFEPRPEVEEMAGVEGWMTDGEVPTASVARVWVSPERARWLREERTVVEELADGAVVVELPYAGTSWLVREILRGAGDLVVLEPTRRARGDRRGADRLSGAADVAPSHPEIERIVAPNPGPMTLEGTNTYLYGSDPCLLIDPGPDDDSHLDAIRAAAERRGGIGAVLLTHAHADHAAGAPTPRRRGDRPGPRRNAHAACGRWRRPGHAADHVCLISGDGVCFSGDLVLGVGFTFVPPDGGSLAAYMGSLEALRAEEIGADLPRPRPLDHRPRGEAGRVRRAPDDAGAPPARRPRARRALAGGAARRGLGRRPGGASSRRRS